MQDLNLVITVAADVLAPKAARTSAGTVMNTKLDMILFLLSFLVILAINCMNVFLLIKIKKANIIS